MGTDDKVTDTDMSPSGPQGVGESITRQGNELVHGAEDSAHQEGGTSRDEARANAQQADREKDRLQGSIDPKRPGPEPD
ncbi:MAG: hypothetical protein ACJ74O_06670 [Frankiaceae bacterium]